MPELCPEARAQLESLLAELTAALAEQRPAKWQTETGGIDFTPWPFAEKQADMEQLRAEVQARLDGVETRSRLLGTAITNLDLYGTRERARILGREEKTRRG